MYYDPDNYGVTGTRDPVHRAADLTWWFWDETWCVKFGPWAHEQAAREGLAAYCQYLDTGMAIPFDPSPIGNRLQTCHVLSDAGAA